MDDDPSAAQLPTTTPGEVEHEPESNVVPQIPQTTLTFLLVSGRRRNMSFDPETTVGRVKELVWNAWPSEWQDERPPAPSFLRILYLGKILQDEDTLSKLNLPSHTPSLTDETPPPPPTIVHLAIRMHAPTADDVPKKKKSSRRRPATTGEGADSSASPEETEQDGGGCCCVVC
ncbi:Ubiquitin-like domain-containing protein [Mycena indigotica]|uniref:Ubiquitin-like domain-containing protein n=1 Tax=Mycena indigotica TaxID=2126181 RepID=A0A8H6W168_9AGAR|nr:Ubiquitin-like domain-containing protein [Mycena indigotica]KAF7301217.1 Ubiquitin-like domain-containing protein [Mycena indigotica]